MKYLLYIAIFILPFLGTAQKDLGYLAHKHVKVDGTGQKYFKMIVKLYKDHDVKIDYRQVRAIHMMKKLTAKNGRALAGFYGPDKIIRVRTTHQMASFEGFYDEIILATMAHELAHSQGLTHEGSLLMMLTKSELLQVLMTRKKRLTDILLEPYIK